MLLPQILKHPRLPLWLLTFFILAYAVYFSWYTINRHNTLNSYAADLSLIDQALWNTAVGPGRFMEQTWGDRQQPRLAEHFEPLLVPLSLLFHLWDDVRVLLIAQAFALALGTLPVFWIARAQLSESPPPLPTLQTYLTPAKAKLWRSPIPPPSHSSSPPTLQPSNLPSFLALLFSAVYLLFPHLQAANIADFHADPFVVAPLLFAFWYATQQRWTWMWFWAVIAMLAKENLPTLTAMLGLWLLFQRGTNRRWIMVHGLGLIVVSTAWFLIATFGIVAPLARQYFGAAGPIYLTNRFDGGLEALPDLLLEPARWRYLWGLLAAAGFLPVLAPELLLLGLPVLAANFLSNFPGQYSGEQHYSAPLVAAFVLAAIYGMRRLAWIFSMRQNNNQPHRLSALIAAGLWLLAWSLGYHGLHGWTPLSIRAEAYAMTPAATHLPDLLAQIPDGAIVSASPGLHPHLAHRRVAYVFPLIQDAEILLIDVTDISGVHPNDARSVVDALLQSDWRLLQATHGLILAQKRLASQTTAALPPCHPATRLPCSFFTFAHATKLPNYSTPLMFGDSLRLLGYDLFDDRDQGVTVRFYWQALHPLAADLRLWPLIFDDFGRLLSDPTQVPMVAPVWYPPAAWPANQVIVTETLPQPLPGTFHLGLAAGPNDSFPDPSRRYPPRPDDPTAIRRYAGNWLHLASFQRQGPFLRRFPPTPGLQEVVPLAARFEPTIKLIGYRLDSTQAGTLAVLLRWTTTAPLATDYTVFLHLLAPDGSRVTQHDAYPTWLTPQPTSQWPPNQSINDLHILTLPGDLPSGVYRLILGLYTPPTLERLTLPNGLDSLTLTTLQIEPTSSR
jgi:uncharacterized membrane protein